MNKPRERRSFSNTGKPVVVKAPTISTYTSIKLLLSGKIIQVGNAKNKGRIKTKKLKKLVALPQSLLNFY